jgi:hypothetical protein
MPLPAQTPLTEPLPVTRPVKPVPVMRPPEMVTTSLVLSEHVVRPCDADAHVPSKLPPPPPPPLRFDERSPRDERSRAAGFDTPPPPPRSPETALSC